MFGRPSACAGRSLSSCCIRARGTRRYEAASARGGDFLEGHGAPLDQDDKNLASTASRRRPVRRALPAAGVRRVPRVLHPAASSAAMTSSAQDLAWQGGKVRRSLGFAGAFARGVIALNPYRVASLGDDAVTAALPTCPLGSIPCSEIRAYAAHRHEFPAGTQGSTTGRVDWGSVIARPRVARRRVL
jgi:hypothetical protein